MIRIFDSGNWDKRFSKKDVCPICKTQNEGKVVLIAISGTQKGHNAQAKQVHLDCLDLWIDDKNKFIFQKFE